MKQLKYFLFGIMSVLFVLPIINRLLEVIELWIETFKISPSKKIMNAQKDVTILSEFLSEPKVETEYDIEYLYDDEDD